MNKTITVHKNFLGEIRCKEVCDFVVESEHLGDFSINDTNSAHTHRRAFSVTYHSNIVPDLLKHYVTDDFNVYNFVGIVTTHHGDLPEHQDDDLTCHMRDTNTPEIYVKMPVETTVYYPSISENMIGGDLCYDGQEIHPETDMLVTFPSNQPHAVTAIHHTDSCRVCLVCEKYKLLPLAFKYIKFGSYRVG